MQPQSSGSNKMTIYDPVRDSRVLMKQGQRMLSGACSSVVECYVDIVEVASSILAVPTTKNFI